MCGGAPQTVSQSSQIYLLHNPLRIEHVKPQLLGHCGTTPGLNSVYIHLNPHHLGQGRRRPVRS
ncbi:hypothetical protein [Methylobacterium oxalidis]|uniref:hypothetical protein n=1 Tax=Methylobacterium oxalidis TaxID=944322 RepID=UPI0027962893|nr:hypothetical protein [Methylobacterium oxalidis]